MVWCLTGNIVVLTQLEQKLQQNNKRTGGVLCSDYNTPTTQQTLLPSALRARRYARFKVSPLSRLPILACGFYCYGSVEEDGARTLPPRRENK